MTIFAVVVDVARRVAPWSVRAGSWHAAFSVAQFGQTMVTQFWHRDATSQNHRWLQLNVQTVGSEARCAVNTIKEGSQATVVQLLPFVPWALCFLVGPIVGHGSRRIRSQSSNAVLLPMLHNMSLCKVRLGAQLDK